MYLTNLIDDFIDIALINVFVCKLAVLCNDKNCIITLKIVDYYDF